MGEPLLVDTLEVPLVLSPSLTLALQLARKGRWAIVSRCGRTSSSRRHSRRPGLVVQKAGPGGHLGTTLPLRDRPDPDIGPSDKPQPEPAPLMLRSKATSRKIPTPGMAATSRRRCQRGAPTRRTTFTDQRREPERTTAARPRQRPRFGGEELTGDLGEGALRDASPRAQDDTRGGQHGTRRPVRDAMRRFVVTPPPVDVGGKGVRITTRGWTDPFVSGQ